MIIYIHCSALLLPLRILILLLLCSLLKLKRRLQHRPRPRPRNLLKCPALDGKLRLISVLHPPSKCRTHATNHNYTCSLTELFLVFSTSYCVVILFSFILMRIQHAFYFFFFFNYTISQVVLFLYSRLSLK